MKHKALVFAAVLSALSNLETGNASPLTLSKVEEKTLSEHVQKELDFVPIPELANASVLMISRAGDAQKEKTAIAALRFCFIRNKSIIPVVVGQISKKYPSVSLNVAVEAAALSPSQALEIVRAASTAAPEYAQSINGAILANNRNSPHVDVQENKTWENNEMVILPLSADNSVRRSVSSRLATTAPVSGSGATFKGTIQGRVGSTNVTTVVSSSVSPGSDPNRANYGRPR